MEKIQQLTAEITPLEFYSKCYLLSPKASPKEKRLVVIHSGHRRQGPLGEGVNDLTGALLTSGFHVLLMDMPLIGWNQHDKIKSPIDGKTISFGPRHDDLFAKVTPVLADGQVFRLFIEPVVQGINFFLATHGTVSDVSMVGLSGGGWATHFCAAIDPRIRNSFPVAGAMPLYARRHSPGSWGDSEQYYEPLYRETDSDGDGVTDTAEGVASWLEIFALGALGTARQQIQILNFDDPCCFSTNVYQTYDQFLRESVQRLGAGQWSLYSDRSHHKHIISAAAISRVILPALRRDK